MRVESDDGRVLADDDVGPQDVDELSVAHGLRARDILAAGVGVTLYVTDPDGLLPDVVIRLDP
jgi:hypothetical protein